MAVYCPLYDAIYGWYILVCGPKGSYKQMIVSPLHYYSAMGVKPPVGSKFTAQDFEDLQSDMTIPLSASTPGHMPAYSLPAPVSVAPQADALGPEFDDLSYAEDSFFFPAVGSASAYDPLYSAVVSSLASVSHLPGVMTPPTGSLMEYANSMNSPANQFGSSFSLIPASSYGVMIASPLAKSAANISSNSSLLVSSPMSSVPSSKNVTFTNGKDPFTPLEPYSPQSSMSSGFKYKYDKLEPLPMNLSPLSTSNGSKNHKSNLQNASSFLNTPPVSSNPKFKNLNPQFSSTSNSKLDYYYPSTPTSSSGKSKVFPSPIGTSNVPVPSTANPSNTKSSSVSSIIYDDADLAYEMNMDGVEESELYEEDYEMSEP